MNLALIRSYYFPIHLVRISELFSCDDKQVYGCQNVQLNKYVGTAKQILVCVFKIIIYWYQTVKVIGIQRLEREYPMECLCVQIQ